MLNFKRDVLLLLFSFICVLPGFTQTVPCQPGTMANVLGTSCSVGPIIFNFQNDFSANTETFNQGIVGGRAISPSEIGFVPIQDHDQAGFKLSTNFSDGPGSDNTFFGSHFVRFSCTPQAAPG